MNEPKERYQQLDLYDAQKAQIYGYLLSTATDGGTGGMRPPLRNKA